MATANQIDFDEQVQDWLKVVRDNAAKVAEHERAQARRDLERKRCQRVGWGPRQQRGHCTPRLVRAGFSQDAFGHPATLV